MSDSTKTIAILGTTGYLTATDGEEVSVHVDIVEPAIIAGIPYSFRTYWVRNPQTGNWRAKESFYIDRLVEVEDQPGRFGRDWDKPVTSNAQQKIYRAAIEAAEAVSQDQLNAGIITRLERKVVTAKEAVTRHEAEYDAAKNMLAEASAQLDAGVLS